MLGARRSFSLQVFMLRMKAVQSAPRSEGPAVVIREPSRGGVRVGESQVANQGGGVEGRCRVSPTSLRRSMKKTPETSGKKGN